LISYSASAVIAFKTFIESQYTTDYQKLTCLRRYLGTEPSELIRGCHMCADKTKAYRMAWERLNNTYGRTKSLKDKVKAELFKGPTIRETYYTQGKNIYGSLSLLL